jgi:hypothetical protein
MKQTAQDSETALTAITQDYLDDMETRIHARFKVSDLSSPHDTQSRQDEFQNLVSTQITQQNQQIQLTMGNMETMMQAMQKLVQDVTSRRSNSPTPSASSHGSFQDEHDGDPLPQQEQPDSPTRGILTQDDRPDYASASTQPTEDSIVSYNSYTNAPKRSAPTQKGESPAAKRSSGGGRQGLGRGRGGRGRGQDTDHRSLRKNLGNSYGPLETMSDARSSSGLI